MLTIGIKVGITTGKFKCTRIDGFQQLIASCFTPTERHMGNSEIPA
jgi:hypothetical protein